MILTLASKELRSIFASPMGWIILAVMQLFLGTYFTLSFNQYFEILSIKGSLPEQMGITKFVCEGIFDTAAVLFIFVIPLVSMRLLSDELRTQTMTFLISAPISTSEIIFGKFLAIVTYLTCVILMMVIMVSSLSKWAGLDYGLLFTNAIGIWLLMVALSAMGLFFSSLTQFSVIAGFLTFLFSSSFLLIDKFITESSPAIFSQLSIMSHYRNFSNGLMTSFGVTFFLIFAAFFIAMSIHRLYLYRVAD